MVVWNYTVRDDFSPRLKVQKAEMGFSAKTWSGLFVGGIEVWRWDLDRFNAPTTRLIKRFLCGMGERLGESIYDGGKWVRGRRGGLCFNKTDAWSHISPCTYCGGRERGQAEVNFHIGLNRYAALSRQYTIMFNWIPFDCVQLSIHIALGSNVFYFVKLHICTRMFPSRLRNCIQSCFVQFPHTISSSQYDCLYVLSGPPILFCYFTFDGVQLHVYLYPHALFQSVANDLFFEVRRLCIMQIFDAGHESQSCHTYRLLSVDYTGGEGRGRSGTRETPESICNAIIEPEKTQALSLEKKKTFSPDLENATIFQFNNGLQNLNRNNEPNIVSNNAVSHDAALYSFKCAFFKKCSC